MALCFDSAKHIHDYDFLLRNPDYKSLIAIIDTGNVNWLNFNISDKDKLYLFEQGAKAAKDFLITFEWEQYKKIRSNISPNYKIKSSAASVTPLSKK